MSQLRPAELPRSVSLTTCQEVSQVQGSLTQQPALQRAGHAATDRHVGCSAGQAACQQLAAARRNRDSGESVVVTAEVVTYANSVA